MANTFGDFSLNATSLNKSSNKNKSSNSKSKSNSKNTQMSEEEKLKFLESMRGSMPGLDKYINEYLDSKEKKPEPETVEYTYKQGDTFGQVIKDLGLNTDAGLWGSNGDVAYYTQQLNDQGISSNIPVGTKIRLTKRGAAPVQQEQTVAEPVAEQTATTRETPFNFGMGARPNFANSRKKLVQNQGMLNTNPLQGGFGL